MKPSSFTIQIYLLAALWCALPAQGQFLWSDRIASVTLLPEGELNLGLALDTNDNCFVTGFFDGTNNFGGVTLINRSAGGSDIYVAKYNATGALQWVQQAGESAGKLNYGRGIGVDTNGNIYVTGGYQGPAKFGSVNLAATSGEQFFLAKYNSSGTVQWVQPSTGGNGDNYGLGLAVDKAGNSYALVVMASSGTSLTFGTKTVTAVKGGQTFTILAKYDHTGAVQWAQLFDTSQKTYATKLAVDAAGNVYVRGLFDSDMTIGGSHLTVSSGANENAFIAKFDNSGTLLWVQSPQSTGGNSGEGGVAVDPAGNVIVSGTFATSLNFGNGITLTNQADAFAPVGNAFLAKYNSSGVIQWARGAGGTNGGIYWDVGLDAQTNIYAAGYLGPVAQTNLYKPAYPACEAAVARYSPAGENQWVYPVSGPALTSIPSGAVNCAVDAAGHCYLSGFYMPPTTFGTNTLPSPGGWNFFLAETVTNPTVPFAANPPGGTLPLTVQFSSPNLDSQGNAITNWNWNFGDGTTSTQQNPAHTYTQAGSFKPVLIGTNNNHGAVTGYGPQIYPIAYTSPTSLIYITNNGAIVILGYVGNEDFLAIPPTINGRPVTTLAENALAETSLTGVLIPMTVTNIGDAQFIDSFALTAITVAPGNPAFTSVGGVLFNSDLTVLIAYPDGLETDVYAIPDGVISIEPDAFADSSLYGVAIPDSVTTIGDSAFQNCGMANVAIPGHVTSLGNSVFYDCQELMNVIIGNSVTNIGASAFYGCSQLKSVTIPNHVTSIGDFAFEGCSSLTNIAVAAANPGYASLDGVLFDQTLKTLIAYPGGLYGSYAVPDGVTSISQSAFKACSGLLNVIIANSVTNIGDSAFESCQSLTNVIIGNGVTSIGNSGFYYCSSLRNLVIGSSVTNIGDEAFDACSSLPNVTIPKSVVSLGGYVFFQCSSLHQAYFEGNAPLISGMAGNQDGMTFSGETGTVYHLPGTTGWAGSFGGWSAALWFQPRPLILGNGSGLPAKSSGFGFTISWATNLSVVVQASTNLSNPVWIPLATNHLASGTNYFRDLKWTNFPQRFYRVRSP